MFKITQTKWRFYFTWTNLPHGGKYVKIITMAKYKFNLGKTCYWTLYFSTPKGVGTHKKKNCVN